MPVELLALPDAPLPEPIEATAYYVVAESVANVHKHAHATAIAVRVSRTVDTVFVEVTDDGVGGADDEGSGLRGLADRVEALGGNLTVESPDGGGTRLAAAIPLA